MVLRVPVWAPNQGGSWRHQAKLLPPSCSPVVSSQVYGSMVMIDIKSHSCSISQTAKKLLMLGITILWSAHRYYTLTELILWWTMLPSCILAAFFHPRRFLALYAGTSIASAVASHMYQYVNSGSFNTVMWKHRESIFISGVWMIQQRLSEIKQMSYLGPVIGLSLLPGLCRKCFLIV